MGKGYCARALVFYLIFSIVIAPWASLQAACPIEIATSRPKVSARALVRKTAFAIAALNLFSIARAGLISPVSIDRPMFPSPQADLLAQDLPALWKPAEPLLPGCDPFNGPRDPEIQLFQQLLGPQCGETRWELSILVDHFTEPPKAQSLVRADAQNATGERSFAADSVLGSERDVALTRQAGILESDINARRGSTDIDYRADVAGRGNLLIIWDGPDQKPDLDPVGLGGINLMHHADHGHDLIRFAVGISETNVPGNFVLRIYSSNDPKAKSYVEATVHFEASVKDPNVANDDPRRRYHLYNSQLQAFGFEPPKQNEDPVKVNQRNVDSVLHSAGAIQLHVNPDAPEKEGMAPFVHIDFLAIEVPHVSVVYPEPGALTSALPLDSLFANSFHNNDNLGLGSGLGYGGFGPGIALLPLGGSPFVPNPGYPPGNPGFPGTPIGPPGGGGGVTPPGTVPEPGSLFLTVVAGGTALVIRLVRGRVVKPARLN